MDFDLNYSIFILVAQKLFEIIEEDKQQKGISTRAKFGKYEFSKVVIHIPFQNVVSPQDSSKYRAINSITR